MDTQDFNDRRSKHQGTMRSTTYIAMGILYLGVGSIFIFGKYFGFQLAYAGTPWGIGLGVIFIIYGVWRIVRGIQKKF